MRKIGALIFPDFELLDLAGPMQMFGMLQDDFEVTLIAESTGPVVSRQGPALQAVVSTQDQADYDILSCPAAWARAGK